MIRRAITAALALACAAMLGGAGARAHPVTVDGVGGEWSSRVPSATNLGLVARDATGRGEYVWLDATGDTRTDLATPERDADVTRVQYTGTAAGLGILVRLAASTPSGAPVQVQVALDLDRADGSGQRFLAGYADTQVASGAAWEYLVQTRFGSGGTARVYDRTFREVGPVAAARGADGVECFVPWSLLGLPGPPQGAVRFTVATFRAQPDDSVVPVGDPTISNALDVVSDHGDPRATAHPNAWDELRDGVVDYSADVYFDPAGEVISPLLVTRFVADATSAQGGEWVAVRNMTAATLSLARFRVGDASVPDGSEGMYAFPTAASLPPGGVYVVASNGADFAARFGTAPDGELTAASAAADLARFTPWATGALVLADDGDEILLLDGPSTVVDAVTWGSGTYPGVTPRARITRAATVYSRASALPDRDDCALDFTDGGAACAASTATADCGACAACTDRVCEPRPRGALCSDGDACNGLESCDGAARCLSGTPLTCDDGNACTVDRCDRTSGCATTPSPTGTSCDDGDPCNGVASCNGSGTCVSGPAPRCDDGSPCTTDVCEARRGCVNRPVAAGTACDDGDRCNGRETCDALGVCAPGAALRCDDGNACTVDRCDRASGCATSPSPSGTSCADGDLCNGLELCDGAGVCRPGTPVVGPPCTPLDAGTDAGRDAGMDTGTDTDRDAGMDTGTDTGTDTGRDVLPDLPRDLGVDSAPDVPRDAPSPLDVPADTARPADVALDTGLDAASLVDGPRDTAPATDTRADASLDARDAATDAATDARSDTGSLGDTGASARDGGATEDVTRADGAVEERPDSTVQGPSCMCRAPGGRDSGGSPWGLCALTLATCALARRRRERSRRPRG